MQPLTGQPLLTNDRTYTGNSRDFEARALHSGYDGDDGIKNFFTNLTKAAMDKMGVDQETQKKTLPETDFSIFS